MKTAGVSPLIKGKGAEGALLEGLREGREGAFEALYHQYSGRVHRLALRFLHDEEQARNALQETFLRVFRKVHTFRGDSGLGTWIYRIASNICLNEIRRPEHTRLRRLGEDEEMAEQDAPVDEQASRREIMERVSEIISTLEPKKRITFIMFYVEDLTADEIAEVLGEGRGTVLKRLQRTRAEVVEMAAEAGLTDQTLDAMAKGSLT